jgi:hypothetical protein
MRLLGLMLVRNAESRVLSNLDRMSAYCDGVVVVDDRSEDDSFAVARSHPLVSDAVSMPASTGANVDWAIPEGTLLNTLYRLADRHSPDWLIRLDDDEYLDGHESLRGVLEEQRSDVSAVRFPRVSVWDDDEFPRMVPLMGSARSMNGIVVRHRPDLTSTQPYHNLLPRGVGEGGRIASDERVTFVHTGWNTLEVRIERARRYAKLDPECRWNHGTSYDRGLLFGYSFAELDDLRAEYRRRVAVGAEPISAAH